MPDFDPDDLARWTGGRWTERPSSGPVGFCVDSRRIGRGQAFVALRTDRRDGHAFLGAALEAGAAAAVVSRADPMVSLPQLVVADPLSALQAIAREHRRLFRGPVVGVTGSAGKTSTKELLAVLLGGEPGGVLATEANLNNHIGVALTLTRIDPAVHRFAVVEAGISAPGEMRVLAAMMDPDMVLVTMVGPAHLEELGGLDGVAREKAELARSLRGDGICIFPASCERYAPFRAIGRARSVVVEASDDLQSEPVEGRARYSVLQSGGSTAVAVVFGPPPPIEFKMARVTGGMAQNAAIAACAAVRLGVRKSDVQRRILGWRVAPLRGEWKIADGRRLYLDCYNANPASMADALTAFNEVAPAAEPRLYVIGCMEELGGDSGRFHLELGRSLSLRAVDQLVVVGGHAESVRQGAIESGSDPARIEVAALIEPLAGRLSTFRGSVFVKGSRRHGLERAFSGAEHAEVSHA